MPNFYQDSPVIGTPPFNNAISFSGIFSPDGQGCSLVQQAPLGEIRKFVDPFYGSGEFIYVKNNALGNSGLLYTWDSKFTAQLSAVTSNKIRPIGISRNVLLLNVFTWLQISGICPIITLNSIPVGSAVGFSSGTAGKLATISAGRQVMNMVSASTIAYSFIKTNVVTTLGSPTIKVPNTDGIFDGITISLAGIPANSSVAYIDGDNMTVTLSANATANNVGTATFLFDGLFVDYMLATFNRPYLQGQIT